MVRSKKHTAWRKSRKFGDVHGGRKWKKRTDGVFRKVHSLSPPSHGQETPILIQDNPSRNFFFPISAVEALEALQALPSADIQGITHIWLRKIDQKEHDDGDHPLAQFVCGSGVRAVVLYPWRTDMRIRIGRNPPVPRQRKWYGRYGGKPVKRRGWWYFEFEHEGLRKLYVNYLLYHEVGHHVDWYQRHWSKANSKVLEEFADQYAMEMSVRGTRVVNRMECLSQS